MTERERYTLRQALIKNGFTPQILWERVKGNGICKSDFRHRYLTADRPGSGRMWDMVMRELDMMGVDW